jgi:hypothetical protein
LNAALAEVEAAKQKSEPRSIGVVKQLPLAAGRSGSSLGSDRFTMEDG